MSYSEYGLSMVFLFYVRILISFGYTVLFTCTESMVFVLDNMPIPIGPMHDSRDIIPDAHHEFIIHGFNIEVRIMNLNSPAGNKELSILFRYIN